MVVCYLGDIPFETVGVESFEQSRDYAFAEHQVIEGQPLLQYIGHGLAETTIGIRLHKKFCTPATAFQSLRDAADRHQAMRLIFADGSPVGWRVITGLSQTMAQTADNGNPICIEARMMLREWVDSDREKTLTDAARSTAPARAGKTYPRARLLTVTRPPAEMSKATIVRSA